MLRHAIRSRAALSRVSSLPAVSAGQPRAYSTEPARPPVSLYSEDEIMLRDVVARSVHE